jgi:hypothetical protein
MLAILFTESQIFASDWKIWAVVLFAGLLVVRKVAMLGRKSRTIGWGYKTAAIVGFVLPILLVLGFMVMHLTTIIDEQGISFGFSWVGKTSNRILWTNVQKAYVRQYKPLDEYGGWGWRDGEREGEGAYNVKGDMGLQLVYDGHKRLLIGTQQAEQLKNVIDSLYKAGIVNTK